MPSRSQHRMMVQLSVEQSLSSGAATFWDVVIRAQSDKDFRKLAVLPLLIAGHVVVSRAEGVRRLGMFLKVAGIADVAPHEVTVAALIGPRSIARRAVVFGEFVLAPSVTDVPWKGFPVTPPPPHCEPTVALFDLGEGSRTHD